MIDDLRLTIDDLPIRIAQFTEAHRSRGLLARDSLRHLSPHDDLFLRPAESSQLTIYD
jgi:hypothetical protein